MQEKKKKEHSPSSRAFRAAALGLASFYLSGSLIAPQIGDQSENIEKDLGITQETRARVTAANVHVLYPEQAAAKVYAYAIARPGLAAEMAEQAKNYGNKDAHELFAFTRSDPLFGSAGLLNTLTLGFFKSSLPCTVIVPSDKIEIEALQNMTELPRSDIENFPGTAKEYRKAFFFHELEHCNQNPLESLWNREHNETLADEKGLQAYLEDDGDPAVVQSIVYMRTLTAMKDALWLGGKGKPLYTAAPALAHRYLGAPPLKADEAAQAYSDAAARLMAGKSRADLSLYMQKPSALYGRVKEVLKNQTAPMTEQVRTVLELNKKAYEFFTTAPETNPAPATLQYIP